MITTHEIKTDHLIRTLRIWVHDLCDKESPFPKDDAYFRNLAGWIACAATRLETPNVQPIEATQPQPTQERANQ